METVTLESPEPEIVEWVKKLSPQAKRSVLKALVAGYEDFERLVEYGSARARELCKAQGLDWDRLSDQERQDWVDRMLHEGGN